MINEKRIEVDGKEFVCVTIGGDKLIGVYPIEKDSENREVYYLKNIYHESGSFCNRVHDAIRMIVEGYGDYIKERPEILFKDCRVVRHLNRSIGDPFRQSCLKDIERLIPVYVVRFQQSNWDYGRDVLNNGTLERPSNRYIRKFNTEEEAVEYINETTEKAKALYDEYLSVKKTKGAKEADKFIKTLRRNNRLERGQYYDFIFVLNALYEDRRRKPAYTYTFKPVKSFKRKGDKLI